MPLERLHKVMAAAGAGSRRECEQFIVEGRVTVDGRVVRELGTKVDPDVSEIGLDGEAVKSTRAVYYMLHKPRGVISTRSDEMGRPSVVDLIPGTPKRIYPVGRLDADSVGLVLLTNDGELAQRLTHPRYEIPKTYEVRVRGALAGEAIERLKKGVWLSDGRATIEGVKLRKRHKTVTELTVTLYEGKNREIRRVMARLGHPVLTLKRLSIGTLSLGDLGEGRHRKLRVDEVAALQRLAEAAAKRAAAAGGNRKPRRGSGAVAKPAPWARGRARRSPGKEAE